MARRDIRAMSAFGIEGDVALAEFMVHQETVDCLAHGIARCRHHLRLSEDWSKFGQ
jgi:hypothetical protein